MYMRENEVTGKTPTDITSQAGRDFLRFKYKLTSSYTCLYGLGVRADKQKKCFKQYHNPFFLHQLSARNSVHQHNNMKTQHYIELLHYKKTVLLCQMTSLCKLLTSVNFIGVFIYVLLNPLWWTTYVPQSEGNIQYMCDVIWYFGKYTYSFSCWEFDEKIYTKLMFIWKTCNSRFP